MISSITSFLAMAGETVAAAATGAAAGDNPLAEFEALAAAPRSDGGSFWMPNAASTGAGDTDAMYYAVLGMSAFFFFLITALTIYFVVKYRHRPGHKAEPSPSHNDTLEITWTVIPCIIVVFLFLFGWRSYVSNVTPPQHALEVNVWATQWNWNFKYAEGINDDNLHVPVNTPIRLVMSTDNVLHSFFVPAFRIKQDIVPRRYTYAWFNATKPGAYRINCAEYCGRGHSEMNKVVVVHPPGSFERWIEAKKNAGTSMPLDQLGKSVYEKKGCMACHSIDGTPRVGPSLKGIWGEAVTLEGGAAITVDENYIRESLLDPAKSGRTGFARSMPSFAGQLSDREILGVIEYLKTLK